MLKVHTMKLARRFMNLASDRSDRYYVDRPSIVLFGPKETAPELGKRKWDKPLGEFQMAKARIQRRADQSRQTDEKTVSPARQAPTNRTEVTPARTAHAPSQTQTVASPGRTCAQIQV